MNFNQLRGIIKNIRSQVRCPSCDGLYTTEDISVVSAVQNRCILVAQCTKCQLPILVTATLSNANQSATHDSTVVTEHKMLRDVRSEDLISSNDVLDIHQFLNNFQGDLKGALLPRDSMK